MKRHILCALSAILLLAGTGCFRVSSDTRALREAALKNGLSDAQEKLELGVGMLTLGVARIASTIASRYMDVPPEARSVLSAVHGAEVSIFEVKARRGNLADILAAADNAMARRDCERLVGVVHERDLVAVYVPRKMNSTRRVRASVLVLNRDHLVCASAQADVRDLLDLALNKMRAEMPQRADFAATN